MGYFRKLDDFVLNFMDPLGISGKGGITEARLYDDDDMVIGTPIVGTTEFWVDDEAFDKLKKTIIADLKLKECLVSEDKDLLVITTLGYTFHFKRNK